MFKALTNPIRIHILKTLIFKENVSFFKLIPAGTRNTSQFNYHLKWLLSNGFVIKKDGHYFLGSEGKKLSIFLSSDLNIEEQPVIVVDVILRDKNKVLISKSKKEPFKNIWEISCVAKIKYGAELEEFAKKIAQEKTGYNVEGVKLKSIFPILTYSNGKLAYHHIHYVFVAEKLRGQLIEETNDRVNKWVEKKDAAKYESFPNTGLFLEAAKNKQAKVIELKVTLDEMKSCEIIKDYWLAEVTA